LTAFLSFVDDETAGKSEVVKTKAQVTRKQQEIDESWTLESITTEVEKAVKTVIGDDSTCALNHSANWMDIGVDSLSSVELSLILQSRFGIELAGTIMLSQPSIADLASYLYGILSLEAGQERGGSELLQSSGEPRPVRSSERSTDCDFLNKAGVAIGLSSFYTLESHAPLPNASVRRPMSSMERSVFMLPNPSNLVFLIDVTGSPSKDTKTFIRQFQIALLKILPRHVHFASQYKAVLGKCDNSCVEEVKFITESSSNALPSVEEVPFETVEQVLNPLDSFKMTAESCSHPVLEALASRRVDLHEKGPMSFYVCTKAKADAVFAILVVCSHVACDFRGMVIFFNELSKAFAGEDMAKGTAISSTITDTPAFPQADLTSLQREQDGRQRISRVKTAFEKKIPELRQSAKSLGCGIPRFLCICWVHAIERLRSDDASGDVEMGFVREFRDANTVSSTMLNSDVVAVKFCFGDPDGVQWRDYVERARLKLTAILDQGKKSSENNPTSPEKNRSQKQRSLPDTIFNFIPRSTGDEDRKKSVLGNKWNIADMWQSNLHGASLELRVLSERDNVVFELNYDVDKIRRSEAEGLLEGFSQIIEFQPNVNPYNQSLCWEEEEDRQIPLEIAGPSIISSLYQLRSSQKIALIYENDAGRPMKLSYAQLWSRATDLVSILRKAGVQRGEPIIVTMNRTASAIVALCGIQLAGAAHVPVLSHAVPAERLEKIVSKVAPRGRSPVMVMDAAARKKFVSDNAKGKAFWNVILLSSEGICAPLMKPGCSSSPSDQLEQLPAAFTEIETQTLDTSRSSQAHPFAIFFTSGSTGEPKGVEISNGAFQSFLENWRKFESESAAFDKENPHARDVVLSLLEISFDAGNFAVFSSLWNGATLVFPSESSMMDSHRWVELVEMYEVTCMVGVPTQLQQFLAEVKYDRESPGQRNSFLLTSLRHIYMGGESLSVSLVKDCEKLFTDGIVWNQYGPTETAVAVTQCNATEYVRENPNCCTVPLGNAIGRSESLCIRELRNPAHSAPKGCVGELYVTGPQLATGYVGEPEKTRDQFILEDGECGLQTRWYHTGDLAYYNEQGMLEFSGRVDEQVKVRGLRVELGEVETCLRAFFGGRFAVCVVKHPSREILVGYLEADTTVEFNREATLANLRSKLPIYMVPAYLILLPRFPVVNGKTDRRKLAKMRPENQEGGAIANPTKTIMVVQPSTQIQSKRQSSSASRRQAITNLVSEFTRQEVLDVDADLFSELGVTSVDAMALALRFQKLTDVKEGEQYFESSNKKNKEEKKNGDRDRRDPGTESGRRISVHDIYRESTINKLVRLWETLDPLEDESDYMKNENSIEKSRFTSEDTHHAQEKIKMNVAALQRPEKFRSRLVPLSSHNLTKSSIGIFCIHGAFRQAQIFRKLAEKLHAADCFYPVYAFEDDASFLAEGGNSNSVMKEPASIERLAWAYVEHILKLEEVLKDGITHVHLVGYCSGAIIASVMAKLLHQANLGVHVLSFSMLDSMAPSMESARKLVAINEATRVCVVVSNFIDSSSTKNKEFFSSIVRAVEKAENFEDRIHIGAGALVKNRITTTQEVALVLMRRAYSSYITAGNLLTNFEYPPTFFRNFPCRPHLLVGKEDWEYSHLYNCNEIPDLGWGEFFAGQDAQQIQILRTSGGHIDMLTRDSAVAHLARNLMDIFYGKSSVEKGSLNLEKRSEYFQAAELSAHLPPLRAAIFDEVARTFGTCSCDIWNVLILVASHAISGHNMQPWYFYVDKASKQIHVGALNPKNNKREKHLPLVQRQFLSLFGLADATGVGASVAAMRFFLDEVGIRFRWERKSDFLGERSFSKSAFILPETVPEGFQFYGRLQLVGDISGVSRDTTLIALQRHLSRYSFRHALSVEPPCQSLVSALQAVLATVRNQHHVRACVVKNPDAISLTARWIEATDEKLMDSETFANMLFTSEAVTLDAKNHSGIPLQALGVTPLQKAWIRSVGQSKWQPRDPLAKTPPSVFRKSSGLVLLFVDDDWVKESLKRIFQEALTANRIIEKEHSLMIALASDVASPDARALQEAFFTLGSLMMKVLLELGEFPRIQSSTWGAHMLQGVGESMQKCLHEFHQGRELMESADDNSISAVLRQIDAELNSKSSSIDTGLKVARDEMLKEFGQLPWIVMRFGATAGPVAFEQQHVSGRHGVTVVSNLE